MISLSLFHIRAQNRISHLATYVWLPVVSRLFLSLKLFQSSVSLCSNALFLSFPLCVCVCVCVCLNVCVWVHKLLTLSVFMLASRTSAKQCSETFILSFFVFRHFCFSKPSHSSPAKQGASAIIDALHPEHKLSFIGVQCARMCCMSRLFPLFQIESCTICIRADRWYTDIISQYQSQKNQNILFLAPDSAALHCCLHDISISHIFSYRHICCPICADIEAVF